MALAVAKMMVIGDLATVEHTDDGDIFGAGADATLFAAVALLAAVRCAAMAILFVAASVAAVAEASYYRSLLLIAVFDVASVERRKLRNQQIYT